MSKKMSIAQQAFTHAIAYAWEHASDRKFNTGDLVKKPEGGYKMINIDPIFGLIDNAQNIQDLTRVLSNPEYKKMLNFGDFDLKGFYEAMKKTIPILLDDQNPTWEHSGTECRGWYRVYGEIKNIKGYFSSFDLGRDQWMAESFYKAGAITKLEWANYLTNVTLNMSSSPRFMTEGRYDTKKMREYWRPESIDRCMDVRLLEALESVA
jgi:hypothetical protein